MRILKLIGLLAFLLLAAPAFAQLNCSGGCAGTFSGVVAANQIVVGTATNVLGSVAVLAATSGGTGLSTAAVGDIPYYNATTPTMAKLADVGAGAYLRSGGVNTAPLYSTLILPNSATANYIPYATSTNTWGESANMTYNGTSFGFGGALSTSVGFIHTGSFTSASGSGSGFREATSVTGLANQNIIGMEIYNTIIEASSGTHGLEALLAFNAGVTAGAATADEFSSIYIPTIAAGTGNTTEANGIHVTAPTGATNNWAVNSSGRLKMNAITAESGTNAALCQDTTTKEVEVNTGVSTCLVSSLRFKDWIEDVSCDEATAIVKAMKPGKFREKGVTAKDNLSMQKEVRFGFAAEEVDKISHEITYYEADGITPRAVDYERYTAVLTRAFQCQGIN